ncbi:MULTISPECIES: hypothetical protein [Parachlamydia]|jgi:hypothetical protein|uniref:hypothetical protein n=1 Tax=Parachlamydia TaxID=83551 RepID=UPI00055A37F2|nr:hypothetical protein [Parachlamydia acanthamoebae]
MTKSIEERVKKLEVILKVNQSKRRIATVIYNPDICSRANLPHIEADVILCLPDNGRRSPRDKSLPSEGYLIRYS